jgi:hypothetical protein
MAQDERQRLGKIADATSLSSSIIDDEKPLTAPSRPVVTSEVLRARLAEAGVTNRQIERFLDPRNGRLRPPADVTNWSAYELLRGVYSTVYDNQKIDEIERWIKAQGPEAIKLRDDLRRKLQNSGLAQVLPGGFDLLPDFYDALPLWAQPWYRLVRPRNFYQLGRHIATQLHWYLDPSQRPRLGPLFCGITWWHGVMLVLYIFQMRNMNFHFEDWLPWLFFTALFGTMILFPRPRRRPLGKADRTDIERVELYLYLSEEYSQAVDHTPV